MIRKAKPSDFEFIYNLYMHPEVNRFLLYEMMDAGSFKPVFDELLAKQVKYVFEVNGETAGMCKLVPFTHRSSHIVYLGGLAILPSFAGKGYGFKMMQEIIAYAKQQGFSRIELSVATINEKAIRLYERAGFSQAGLLKKYSYLKSEDRFLDEILMAWMEE